MRAISLLLLTSLLMSCGYRSQNKSYSDKVVTLSVPNISGDTRGYFNNALVKAFSESGCFSCSQSSGRYSVEVSIAKEQSERIGFRYDREPLGALKKNILGTENRRDVTASVSVIDTLTQKVIFGPEEFFGSVEFDYVDPDNVDELSFIGPDGKRIKIIEYSLGQLDSIEGAQDSSGPELYRMLAENIVDGMMGHQW